MIDAPPAAPLLATSRLDRAAAWLRGHAWIIVWWASGRLVVVATVLLVETLSRHGELRTTRHAHQFVGLLGVWDGRWYRMIAANGYLLIPGHQSDPAFFPLFPVLLRGVHAAGIGYFLAGLLLSNAAFVVALTAFHALTRDVLGTPLARRATIYLAIFPLGYVFSMTYPESIVLAAISLAALAAAQRRWSTAMICAAVAALTRPEGLVVLLPILISAYRRNSSTSQLNRGVALAAVIAPIAALASFPAYLGVVLHDPLAWNSAEHAWGRRFSPLGFVHALTGLPGLIAQNPWLIRDVVCFVLYLGLLEAARRAGTPRPWLVGGLLVIVLPVFSGAFTAVGRFGLLVPPIFWGLAWLGRRAKADRAIRVASLALLIGATFTIPYVFP